MQEITVEMCREALKRWKRNVIQTERDKLAVHKNKFNLKIKKITILQQKLIDYLETTPEHFLMQYGLDPIIQEFLPNHPFHHYARTSRWGQTKEELFKVLPLYKKEKKLFTIRNLVSRNPNLVEANIRPLITQLIKDDIIYIHTPGRGQGKRTVYGFTKNRLYFLDADMNTAFSDD